MFTFKQVLSPRALVFYALTSALLLAFFGLASREIPWRSKELFVFAVVLGIAACLLYNSRYRWVKAVTLVSVGFLGVLTSVGYYHAFDKHHGADYPILAFNQNPQNVFETLPGYPSQSEKLYDSLREKASSGDVIRQADDILEKGLTFYHYDVYPIGTDLNWSADPFSDPSWNWSLHNVSFIIPLVRAYEASGETHYLGAAQDIVIDWIDDNRLYLFEPPSKFSWHDHTTAFRLLNFLYFFDVWRRSDLYNVQLAEKYLRSFQGHGEKLADSEFYTENHNHGIDQDRALLALSLTHDVFLASAQWRPLALKRVMQQFDFSVSQAGMHLEHSPAYHLYGINQRKKTLTFFEVWGVETALQDTLSAMIQNMEKAVPMFLKPDGNLVQTGDTGVQKLLGYKQYVSDLITQPESMLTGDSKTLVTAYEEEGYVAIRNFAGDRSKFDQSLYVYFTAGAHEGRTHRQSDDLSLVVSNLGQELLVDSGYYSYRSDWGRKYVKSVFSHNTVAIDNQNYQGFDTSLDDVAFDPVMSDVTLTASHRNYPGKTHYRTLGFFANRYLVVLDQVKNDPQQSSKQAEPGTAVAQWHVSPHLALTQTQTNRTNMRRYLLSDEIATHANLYQFAQHIVSSEVAKGQSSPPRGWYSPKQGSLIPTPVLLTEFNSDSLLMSVFVLPDNHSEPKPVLDITDISTTDCEIRVNFTAGGDHFNLVGNACNAAPDIHVGPSE